MTATLTTLVNFPYPTSGAGSPLTDLIADSRGDLIAASPLGPYNDGDTSGLVFEIAKTSGGYATRPRRSPALTAPTARIPDHRRQGRPVWNNSDRRSERRRSGV